MSDRTRTNYYRLSISNALRNQCPFVFQRISMQLEGIEVRRKLDDEHRIIRLYSHHYYTSYHSHFDSIPLHFPKHLHTYYPFIHFS